MEDILRVGVITTTHGIRGEVKVFPTTDDPKRFKKFKGIDNINDVEQYKKCDLYVSRKNAVKLAPNENFIVDLIGLLVVLEDGTKFGTLVDVIQTGANDVYVVKTEEGKEVLLPAIPECILDVNLDTQTVTIHLMKGLVD